MRAWSVVVSVALAVLCAAPGKAQVNCGKLSYTACGGPPAHENPATGNTLGLPVHSDCRICTGNNGIYDCHSECGASFGYGSTIGSVYASLLAAAQESDIGTVLALAPLASDFVQFNPSRSAVQILSCTGEHLISSLRVRSAAHLTLASRLRVAPEAIETPAYRTVDAKSW